MNQLPEVEAHLRDTPAYSPEDARGHAALAEILLTRAGPGSSEFELALGHLRDAINLGDQSQRTVQLFVATLSQAGAIPGDWNVENALVHALHTGFIKPRYSVPLVLSILTSTPTFKAALDMADRADREAIERLITAGDLHESLAHPLFLALLRSTVSCGPVIEFLLTAARRYYLLRAMEFNTAAVDPGDRQFCHALADTCLLNDYVFWQDPDETLWSEVLTESFGTLLQEDSNTDPFPAAMAACYRHIAREPWAEKLESLYGVPGRDPYGFTALVRRHISEPREEAVLAARIPMVGMVSDGTSLTVKQFYEENPYPKWRQIPLVTPTSSARDVIRKKFRHADFTYTDQLTRPDVLIAGCGTGLAIMRAALASAPCDVTAVDLSRTSLAYAKRQLSAAGMTNIAYFICDILELHYLDKEFDIIECDGVLHHMADPKAGLRNLTKCLRPGGIMRLGLYSTAGRRGLAAARRYAEAVDYPRTAAGLRRFRRDVLAATRNRGALFNEATHMLERSDVTAAEEFYSMTMCRDLIFHVQERTYTIPEVGEMLASVGLRFIGFVSSYPEGTLDAYARRYPDDPNGLNLAHWTAFEADHPSTFASMYEFAAQKPLAPAG